MRYDEILRTYAAKRPPSYGPRPRVGAVIKEIRVDKGIRQKDFAALTGIHESTLKSIENDHQKATSVKNLETCARLLETSVENLILLGRERDASNYFAQKHKAPQPISGIRNRKQFPQEWREALMLHFRNFKIQPVSPSAAGKRDFIFWRVTLPPSRSLTDLSLPYHQTVLGFVAHGFNIEIVYGDKKRDDASDSEQTNILTANQGFALNGRFPHSFKNLDKDHEAVIFLITRMPYGYSGARTRIRMQEPDGQINIAEGMHQLRREKSERKDRPLSLRHLAELTESLDHEQIATLMRMKKGSSVIYWEKIEELLAGTQVSMETFLRWSRALPASFFSLVAAPDRSIVSYETYHGLKIYTVSAPGTTHEFFCGELSIEGKKSAVRKNWERKDEAMIGLFVEEGIIEVTIGKSRSPLPLLKGESIYFDGSLGYILRNPGEEQAKGFFATCPGIQI